MILQLLETIFSGESRSILEILEHTLFLISDHTPAHGALPENMREVTREMYARLALFDEISDKKFEKLNVMLVELDSKKAMQVAVIKYISPFSGGNSVENGEETRDGILRFMWKYAQTGLKDEIKYGQKSVEIMKKKKQNFFPSKTQKFQHFLSFSEKKYLEIFIKFFL